MHKLGATFVAMAVLLSFAVHAEDAPRAVTRIGGAQRAWSLEVSLRSDDDVADLNDIAGDGTPRLDIDGNWNTLTVKAVGDLSLQELLSWRSDWWFFSTVGYYRSDIERTVLNLGSGAGETVGDDEPGLLLGTGLLYELGFADLRGYVRWYGLFDDREAWDAGMGVQLSF